MSASTSVRQEVLMGLLPKDYRIDYLTERSRHFTLLMEQASQVHPNEWYSLGIDMRIAVQRFKNLFSLKSAQIQQLVTFFSNQLLSDELLSSQSKVHLLKLLNDLLSIRTKLPTLVIKGEALLQLKQQVQKPKYPQLNHPLMTTLIQNETNYFIKRMVKYVHPEPVRDLDNRDMPRPGSMTFFQRAFLLSKQKRDLRIAALFANAFPLQGDHLLLPELFSSGGFHQRNNAWWFLIMKLAKNNKEAPIHDYLHEIQHQLAKNLVQVLKGGSDFFSLDNYSCIKISAKSSMELIVQMLRPSSSPHHQTVWRLAQRIFCFIDSGLNPDSQSDSSYYLLKLLKYFVVKFVDRYQRESGASLAPSNQDQLNPPYQPACTKPWALDKSSLLKFSKLIQGIIRKLIFLHDEGFTIAKSIEACCEICGKGLTTQVMNLIKEALARENDVALSQVKNLVLFMIPLAIKHCPQMLFSVIQKGLTLASQFGITQNADFFEIVSRCLVYLPYELQSREQAQRLIKRTTMVAIQNLQLIAGSFSPSPKSINVLQDLKNVFLQMFALLNKQNLQHLAQKFINRVRTVIPSQGTAFCSMASAFSFYSVIAVQMIDQIARHIFREGQSAPELFLARGNTVYSTTNNQHLLWYYNLVHAVAMYQPKHLLLARFHLVNLLDLGFKCTEGLVFNQSCALLATIINNCLIIPVQGRQLLISAPPAGRLQQQHLQFIIELCDKYLWPAIQFVILRFKKTQVSMDEIFDHMFLGQKDSMPFKVSDKKSAIACLSIAVHALQGLAERMPFSKLTQHSSLKELDFRGRLLQLLQQITKVVAAQGWFSDFGMTQIFVQLSVLVLGEVPLSDCISEASQKIDTHRCIQNQDIGFSLGPLLLAHIEAGLLRCALVDYSFMQSWTPDVLKFYYLLALLHLHPESDEMVSIRFYLQKSKQNDDLPKQMLKWLSKLVKNKLLQYCSPVEGYRQQQLKSGVSKILQILKRVFKQNNQHYCKSDPFMRQLLLELIPIVSGLPEKSDRVIAYQCLVALLTYNNETTLLLSSGPLLIHRQGPVSSSEPSPFPPQEYSIPLVSTVEHYKALIRQAVERLVAEGLTWREYHLFGLFVLQAAYVLSDQQLQQLLLVFGRIACNTLPKINQLGRAGVFRIFDLLKHRRYVKTRLEGQIRRVPFSEFVQRRHVPFHPEQNRIKSSENQFYVCCDIIKKELIRTGVMAGLDWHGIFKTLELQEYDCSDDEDDSQSKNIEKQLFNFWGKVSRLRGFYHASLVQGAPFLDSIRVYLRNQLAAEMPDQSKQLNCACLATVLFVRAEPDSIDFLVRIIQCCTSQVMENLNDCFTNLLPYANPLEVRPLFSRLLARLSQLKGAVRNRYFELWSNFVSVLGRWSFQQRVDKVMSEAQSKISQQAEGEGFIKVFISVLVECLIVSINCRQLERWVIEPLEQLVAEQRVIFIGAGVALENNPLIMDMAKKFELKLETERNTEASVLRVYSDMALKFAQFLSVLTFSRPLFEFYRPILRFILQHKHHEFNQEDALRRIAEAHFPAPLFSQAIDLALAVQGNRYCLQKKLYFVQHMLVYQLFATNRLIELPNLPKSLKSVQTLANVCRVLVEDELVYLLRRAVIKLKTEEEDEAQSVMTVMAVLLIRANESWSEQSQALMQLKGEGMRLIIAGQGKYKKLAKEWGGLLVKGVPDPRKSFGSNWHLLQNLTGPYSYMM